MEVRASDLGNLLGHAVGMAIYTRWLSSDRAFDWGTRKGRLLVGWRECGMMMAWSKTGMGGEKRYWLPAAERKAGVAGDRADGF